MLRGAYTKLKKTFFYVFWLFIYMTTAFLGPENTNFWKQVSKCKFLKTLLLSSLCKLQKCESVKTVKSCVCALCVQSIDTVCVQVCSVYSQSDIANYWPGMYNTVFLAISVNPCDQRSLSSVHKTFKKRKRKTLLYFVQSSSCKHIIRYELYPCCFLLQCSASTVFGLDLSHDNFVFSFPAIP